MKHVLTKLLGSIFALLFMATQSYAQSFQVLSYHDVRNEVDGQLEAESTMLSTNHLARHFSWLKAHGYQPVSMQAIIDANAGKSRLPEKALLLTFDDGYASFYHNVMPLLQSFDYPAVLALVGSWLAVEAPNQVQYGDKLMPRDYFLSTAQIKEIVDSGLVEIASHSYDLHHGVMSNVLGSSQAAAVTHAYDQQQQTYESTTDYHQRIQSDLQKNSDYIQSITGKKPRVMVWPYGEYNQATINAAKRAGMPFSLTLNDPREYPSDTKDLTTISRFLIDANPTEKILQTFNTPDHTIPQQRIVHVDLDYIYDADAKQMHHNIDLLIERIKLLHPSTVYLQAFSDVDANGNAEAMYFPNPHLPMRADLFGRVARQLQVRSGVEVYAWMPVLAFELEDAAKTKALAVQSINSKSADSYQNLSPFSPEARQIIGEIYSALASHARFQGVLFHDDALLNDFEDNSPAARKVYQQWGITEDIATIRQNPELLTKWSQYKAQYLTQFTLQLANRVKQWQPTLKTARNLYAPLILNYESENWFSQNYRDFLKHYDYTAVMAMPYMEGAKESLPWLKRLINRVKQTPNALNKTVFELQARNWRTKQAVDNDDLVKQMHLLKENGALHWGYYPDDLFHDQPKANQVIPYISTNDFPYQLGSTIKKPENTNLQVLPW